VKIWQIEPFIDRRSLVVRHKVAVRAMVKSVPRHFVAMVKLQLLNQLQRTQFTGQGFCACGCKNICPGSP